MNTKSENILFSLLVNDDFINYVVNPNMVLNEMWNEFFRTHPETIEPAQQARAILLGDTLQHTIPDSDKEILFRNILAECESN